MALTDQSKLALRAGLGEAAGLEVANALVGAASIGIYRNGSVVGSYGGATATERGTALLSAKNAALSGDTIFVGPGSYTISANLLKDGVNYHFEVGAVVTRSDSGDGSVWDDYTNGANGACTSIVTGAGTFIRTGSVEDEQNCVILLTHSASDLTIHAHNLENNSDFATALLRSVVRHVSGRLNIFCNDILGPNCLGLWWSDGEEYIVCNELVARSLAFYVSPCSAGESGPGDIGNQFTSGYMWVKGRKARTTTADSNGNYLCGTNGLYATLDDDSPRVWLDFDLYDGTDNGAVFNCASGIFWYLDGEKAVQSHNGAGCKVLYQGGGKLWNRIGKLQGGVGGTCDFADGECWMTTPDINDGGVQTNAHCITVGADEGGGVGAGGTVHLSFQSLVKSSTGRAINVQGGTCNVLSGAITTSNGSQKDLYKATNDSVLNVSSGVQYDPAKTTGIFTIFGNVRAPNMTGTARDALNNPQPGTVIYNTTTNKLNVRVAAGWEAVTSS